MYRFAKRTGLVVLGLLTLLAGPRPADAQAPRLLTTLGYGAMGATAGGLVTAGAECSGDSGFICIPGEFVVGVIGGGVAGLLLGNALASSANKAVAEGRSVGSGTLTALALGSVAGGALVGLSVGALLINNGESGTVLGSDEQTALVTALAGAGFGVFHLSRRWGALTGRPMEVAPSFGTDGRVGVRATARF